MKDTQKAANDTKMSKARYSELKQMLAERRREIQAEVQGKMRGVREEGAWGGKMNEVLDAVESAEADIQEDLEFALVQMKSETLNKINDALARLEQGDYGNCYDCGEEIAEKRLRHCRSRFAARIAKRSRRTRSSVNVRSMRAAAPRPSSWTCKIRRPSPGGSAGGGAQLSHRPSFRFRIPVPLEQRGSA